MAMAEAGDRHSGKEVEVHVAVDIGQRGPFTVIEGHTGQRGNPLAPRREIALLLFKQCARARPGRWSCYCRKFALGFFHREKGIRPKPAVALSSFYFFISLFSKVQARAPRSLRRPGCARAQNSANR